MENISVSMQDIKTKVSGRFVHYAKFIFKLMGWSEPLADVGGVTYTLEIRYDRNLEGWIPGDIKHGAHERGICPFCQEDLRNDFGFTPCGNAMLGTGLGALSATLLPILMDELTNKMKKQRLVVPVAPILHVFVKDDGHEPLRFMNP